LYYTNVRHLFLLTFSIPVLAAAPNPKSLSSYSFDASRPIVERVADMPDWLLQFLRKMDEAPHYKSYRPSAQEKIAWSEAVNGLPPRMKKILKNRLIAVYFISGLKGNGLTDWVLDSSSHVYTYIALNPAGLRQTLSETLTEREVSVFQGIASVSVDAGKGGSGILYSVAHESAHVFDYVVGLTPYTHHTVARALSRPINVSWDAWSSYERPWWENDFPTRSRLRFYNFRPPELKPDKAPQVYRQFSRSPFASLYGSVNWADDIADLFVFHHITSTLGRPYRIRVGGPNGFETVLEPMSNPVVRQRAEKLLAPIY
jgi:hypothetical protein